MTKKDLVLEVASQNPALGRDKIEAAVNIFFEGIAHYLSHQQRVELRGLGSFSVRERKAYTAHNPRDREYVDVQSKRIPFYKPSSLVTKALAEQTTPEQARRPLKKKGFFE